MPTWTAIALPLAAAPDASSDGQSIMSLWTAIGLTLAGSTVMNLGLVFQKKGVSQFAGLPATEGRLGKYLTSPVWCLGMFLLLAGYGLFMRANFSRAAPISLLQPIFASGVLVVALMAVVYLKERFGALEWLGVGLLLVGVVLLGASAEKNDTEHPWPDVPRLLLLLGGAGALIVVLIVTIKTQRERMNVEVLYGLLAGVMLGVGYMSTKVFALPMRALYRTDDPRRAEESLYVVLTVGLVGLLFGLVGGLVVLQKGFRRGRALIVTAVNLVVNQVVVVAGGLFCLGEHFPREPAHFAFRVTGLGAILVGTVILARVGGVEKPAAVPVGEQPQPLY